MFRSRMVFLRMADRTTTFPVRSNPRWQLAAILTNFKWPYLSNMSTLYTDLAWPSDTVRTDDAYDRRLDTYFTREGGLLADL